jgi:hypothetical protein
MDFARSAKGAGRFITFAVLLSLLPPILAHAKRLPPPKVAPVVSNGVRYVVPNDNGRRAYVQASDTKTNRLLWEVTIFRNSINPLLEEDVQHVYIERIGIEHGKLIVVDEHARAYSVDLQTRAVTKLPKPNPHAR